VDGTQFDNLIKRLSTRPLTRGKALRGLAAGAAALAGVTLATEPGEAKKNHEKEVRICVWSATGGQSKKVDKDKAKKILRRNACARKGSCTGANPCPAGVPTETGTGIVSPIRRDALAGPSNPGFACLDNSGCTADLACIGGTCQACTEDVQCRGGQTCATNQGVCCEGNLTCGENCLTPETVCSAQVPCGRCNQSSGACESSCTTGQPTCAVSRSSGNLTCCATASLCNSNALCCDAPQTKCCANGTSCGLGNNANCASGGASACCSGVCTSNKCVGG
jgi:hypothetical protein